MVRVERRAGDQRAQLAESTMYHQTFRAPSTNARAGYTRSYSRVIFLFSRLVPGNV